MCCGKKEFTKCQKKTKEELNVIKEEVETVNKKLHELTPDELEQVTGGFGISVGATQCGWGKTGDDAGFCSVR